MPKLKKRLDAFSDAIIAIIITIIVLELPIKVVNGTVNFRQLFLSIGIYAVSFCFVANMWYQHALVFDEVDTITNQDVVRDLIFLMLLSLMPTFTRLMSTDPIRPTVMLYGLLYLILIGYFQFLAHGILRQKYQSDEDFSRIYKSIYGRKSSRYLYVIIIGLIVLGYFIPKVAMILYIAIPICSFLLNSQEREEINDMNALPADGRQRFLAMPDSDKIRFGKMIRSYLVKNRNRSALNTPDQQQAWQQLVQQAQTEFNISEEDLTKWFAGHRQRINRQVR
ncbi:TMEM175 family protein [Lapidilactobacillus mulanensis]|uniref:TMEM175 family protein n=1 Tax=Lapidilactobacillus mulanensis TaxID=2485999 RepID=A0ABW4DMH5_9LACO|nr:TMEM175 family protein [Lapidilactobacillus mulanensis]